MDQIKTALPMMEAPFFMFGGQRWSFASTDEPAMGAG